MKFKSRNDFEHSLKFYQEKVEKSLQEFFKRKEAEFSHYSPSAKKMFSGIKEFTLRPAKRIRPILVLIGYESAGKKIDEKIIRASIALELLQSYLLIHDDVMDQSDTRRGKKSFHKEIEGIYSRKVNPKNMKRFSENEAIIAGDLCHSLAVDALLESGFGAEKAFNAIKKLMKINKLTAIGQELDLLLENTSFFDEKNVLMVQELKTAKYTIEGPLHVGAILAGASEKHLNSLSDYAVPVGIAFQMHDDVLGLFGSNTGKSASSDLIEGKKTLLAWFALNKGNLLQKKLFLKAFGKKNASARDISLAKNAVLDSGAKDYSELFSLALVEEAFESIEKAKMNAKSKDFLIELGNYLVSRDN